MNISDEAIDIRDIDRLSLWLALEALMTVDPEETLDQLEAMGPQLESNIYLSKLQQLALSNAREICRAYVNVIPRKPS
jgi:hypothetical protein